MFWCVVYCVSVIGNKMWVGFCEFGEWYGFCGGSGFWVGFERI